MKGIYILKLNLKKNQEIMIGKLGKIFFEKGSYYYVGSSQNNIEKRIERHFSKEKKLHWHIDYLTTNPAFEAISAEKFINCPKEKECQKAKEFLKKNHQKKGFDCSTAKSVSTSF